MVWVSEHGKFEIYDMPIHVQHYVHQFINTRWWEYTRRRVLADCINVWCECEYGPTP